MVPHPPGQVLCNAGTQTQSFIHATQTLYKLNYNPNRVSVSNKVACTRERASTDEHGLFYNEKKY